MHTLEVPGNILLLGEYAILEEGGLGVAMAIDRKITFSVKESDSFAIKGQRGNQVICWQPDRPESDHFIDTIYRECLIALNNERALEKVQKYEITINSRAHHSPTGQKYGFGSSAVIACGLTYLLFYLAGLDSDPDQQFKTALQSHRQAQGNHGSGYDIAASFHGGIGLFSGGKNPKWKPLKLPWLPPGYVFPGPEAVSTVSAVKKYLAYKSENKKEVDSFCSFSNKLVEQFIRAGSWHKGIRILRQYRDESIRFQQKLQIEAAPAPIPDCDEKEEERVVKALGAGNELGSLWGHLKIKDKNQMIPINQSKSGPEWVD